MGGHHRTCHRPTSTGTQVYSIINLCMAKVSANNQSIFLPGEDPPLPQFGFHRSELIPAANNGTNITVQGTTTFHWSIHNDPLRPLNFSHEYHPAWHETADFSTSEITFLTRTPFNRSFDPTVHDPKTTSTFLRVQNLSHKSGQKVMITIPSCHC
ncbi:hypothetical protein CPB84DRAFT_1791824 [Gymnopilus junonius]|uniref:Glycoside hydrolase 131 catalytic N-terminal domain-containing protein n=1 Tax=Gymnopilus junonius TaxID=109634 RepID=A0A9P5NE53_GYMJU|nr:hypothetical protein CPB84DRAFT_1791824 [Gymnopilus junonius]